MGSGHGATNHAKRNRNTSKERNENSLPDNKFGIFRSFFFSLLVSMFDSSLCARSIAHITHSHTHSLGTDRQTDSLVKCDFYYSFIARKYFRFTSHCDARVIAQFFNVDMSGAGPHFDDLLFCHRGTFFKCIEPRRLTVHGRITCHFRREAEDKMRIDASVVCVRCYGTATMT